MPTDAENSTTARRAICGDLTTYGNSYFNRLGAVAARLRTEVQEVGYTVPAPVGGTAGPFFTVAKPSDDVAQQTASRFAVFGVNMNVRELIDYCDVLIDRLVNGDPPAPVLPPAPTGFTAVADGRNVDLAWEAVPGAEFYPLRSRSSYDPVGQVNELGNITGTTSRRGGTAGLPDGTHMYWVTAVVDGVESPESTRVSVSTPETPAEPTPPPPPPPVAGVTLFADNFETGNLSGWDAVQTTPTGHDSTPQPVPGRMDLLARPGGGTMLRVRRPAGDRERSELLLPGNCDVADGDIRTVTVDWMFPDNFPTPTNRWFIVYQQHAGSGSPAFCIEVNGDDELVVRNNRNNTETVIAPIDRGVWHRYDITVKFATGGWVEVRRDGVLVLPRTNRVTWPADYGKIGIYTEYAAQDVTAELFVDSFRFSRP